MKRTGLIILVLAGLMQLAGCSSENNNNLVQEGVSDDTPSLAIPYSKGPSGPPSINGPSGPPESVDAMTEVEELEYSLPGATESEFKQ